MIIKKIKKLFFCIFLLIQMLHTEVIANEVKIILKIKNEIITNIDIKNETDYLSALNNDFLKLEEDTRYELAKGSIIKEKIKINELKRYYNLSDNFDIFDKVFENFYKKLNFSNESEFETYLKNYDLKVQDVREKFKIETLWNELIYTKYKSKINIDINKIKMKIAKNKDKKKYVNYFLSEIVFGIEKANELEEKYEAISDSIDAIGFKNTANIYSISDTSKLGGELGWIQENQISNQITDQIKDLEIGNWSKPIKVSNGFLILKVNEKKMINREIDLEKELNKQVNYETNKQLNQYSLIYFNKIKYNQTGNEL